MKDGIPIICEGKVYWVNETQAHLIQRMHDAVRGVLQGNEPAVALISTLPDGRWNAFYGTRSADDFGRLTQSIGYAAKGMVQKMLKFEGNAPAENRSVAIN